MGTSATVSEASKPVAAAGDVRKGLVWLLYGSMALWGVVDALLPFHGTMYVMYVVVPLMIASTAMTWLALDARMRGIFVPRIMHLIVLITWPVALPLYLVYTRRLRGLGFALLHACGLLLVAWLAMFVAYVVYDAVAFPVWEEPWAID